MIYLNNVFAGHDYSYFDDKKELQTKHLNGFQYLLRSVFGCYAETHLLNVVKTTYRKITSGSIQTSNYPQPLQELIGKAQKAYPHRFNKTNIEEGLPLFKDMQQEFLDAQCPELQNCGELKKFITASHSPEILANFKKDERVWNKWLVRHFNFSRLTFVKDEQIGRVINANRVKRVILANNLQHLDVAEKCLIRRKFRFEDFVRDLPWGYHDDWSVVANMVSDYAVKDISRSEVQELATFVILTGYQDFAGAEHNIKRDLKTRKIVFFDTEDASFSNGMAFTKIALIRNLFWDLKCIMTQEAREWLAQYGKEMSEEEGAVKVTPIYQNTSCDSKEIDIAKVREEFEKREIK